MTTAGASVGVATTRNGSQTSRRTSACSIESPDAQPDVRVVALARAEPAPEQAGLPAQPDRGARRRPGRAREQRPAAGRRRPLERDRRLALDRSRSTPSLRATTSRRSRPTSRGRRRPGRCRRPTREEAREPPTADAGRRRPPLTTRPRRAGARRRPRDRAPPPAVARVGPGQEARERRVLAGRGHPRVGAQHARDEEPARDHALEELHRTVRVAHARQAAHAEVEAFRVVEARGHDRRHPASTARRSPRIERSVELEEHAADPRRGPAHAVLDQRQGLGVALRAGAASTGGATARRSSSASIDFSHSPSIHHVNATLVRTPGSRRRAARSAATDARRRPPKRQATTSPT